MQIQASINNDLSTFGTSALQSKVLNWVADAEAHPPRLETWDVWGTRQDQLITSEGWRNLQDMGIAEGMVAIAYENGYAEYSRVYRFLKYHLWTGSCAYVACPSAMTDGAARLLSKYTGRGMPSTRETEVCKAAYERLTSRDPRNA